MKPLTSKQRQLVTDHLDLASNLAIKYADIAKYLGIDIEDLKQEAAYGLCMAALNYDSNTQATFRTYAHKWCLKYITLTIRHGYSAYTVSKPVEDYESVLFATESIDEKELQRKMRELFRNLSRIEEKVIRRVYGFNVGGPKGFKDIGRELRISPERVHQIYDKAMFKLEEISPSLIANH
ncbi:MAG: sigma-70 family RNA polymerase sigma factor [Prevotellaceae bacterium]|nr:sigma-70 family RNA polymerase sigma factor [Prevotellaceae bacterium]